MIRLQPRPITWSGLVDVAQATFLGFVLFLGWLTRLRHHRMAALALTGFLIEALLGLRLWVQLSNRPISGLTAMLMDVTNQLVSPFRSMDGVVPIKQTGILEFATLAAIEAYLVMGLALVLLFFAAGEIIRDISRMASRKHHRTAQRGVVGRTREPASR